MGDTKHLFELGKQGKFH